MKILVVSNLYPTEKRQTRGIFVKEQVEVMRAQYSDLIIDVRVIEGERPRWEYLQEMIQLPAVVKHGRYDIVHAHFGLTLVSTLFVSVPIVVTFHGSDLLANPTRHVSRLLAPTASKVIVVAQRLRESLGYGEVIPCGIDVDKFSMPSNLDKKQNPGPPDEIKVLFPSDPINRIKDYALFRLAMQELQQRGYIVQEVHLVNIERKKVPDVYWNCDIMLLTSLSEGSPTVIKEAIAAKLPFVSVDVGDVREWADLVDFGVVVPDRDPKTIANSVIALLRRIKERSALDNSSGLELMNNTNIARRIRRVYDEILKDRT